jgi:quinol monooxygenase YgiN
LHAIEGKETEVAALMREVAAPTHEEPGCLAIGDYRSTRDPLLFYIHSRWLNEAAFERHASLPHTVRFLERVRPLLDHEFEVTRTEQFA